MIVSSDVNRYFSDQLNKKRKGKIPNKKNNKGISSDVMCVVSSGLNLAWYHLQRTGLLRLRSPAFATHLVGPIDVSKRSFDFILNSLVVVIKRFILVMGKHSLIGTGVAGAVSVTVFVMVVVTMCCVVGAIKKKKNIKRILVEVRKDKRLNLELIR